MNNYFARTIEPIVSAICDEFNRKFLTKTARSQDQKIMFFRDLFKLAPLEAIVNAGRDFTSSEIMTPNEVRQKLGLRPAQDMGADELRNRYVNASPVEEGEDAMESSFAGADQVSPEPQDLASTRVSDLGISNAAQPRSPAQTRVSEI